MKLKKVNEIGTTVERNIFGKVKKVEVFAKEDKNEVRFEMTKEDAMFLVNNLKMIYDIK